MAMVIGFFGSAGSEIRCHLRASLGNADLTRIGGSRCTPMPGNRRYAAKRDLAEPAVVEAIEAAGCIVYRSLPCDLLIRRHSDPPGMLRTLEVKTPQKRGGIRKRKDQQAQDEFLASTGTPRVTTPEAALAALGVV